MHACSVHFHWVMLNLHSSPITQGNKVKVILSLIKVYIERFKITSSNKLVYEIRKNYLREIKFRKLSISDKINSQNVSTGKLIHSNLTQFHKCKSSQKFSDLHVSMHEEFCL